MRGLQKPNEAMHIIIEIRVLEPIMMYRIYLYLFSVVILKSAEHMLHLTGARAIP